MMKNQELNSRDQSIILISAHTAKGNISELKSVLSEGLEAGLSISEIKEVLVQLYAYCGFPRSLNALNAFIFVLDQRKSIGIIDSEGRSATPVTNGNKYERGKKNLQKLTGVEEKTQKEGVNRFAPLLDTFLKEHLFADIFSRDILSYQQRELATISALATLSGVESQLQAHINMGMNTGITEPQLKQTFDLIGTNIGKLEEKRAHEILVTVVRERPTAKS